MTPPTSARFFPNRPPYCFSPVARQDWQRQGDDPRTSRGRSARQGEVAKSVWTCRTAAPGDHLPLAVLIYVRSYEVLRGDPGCRTCLHRRRGKQAPLDAYPLEHRVLNVVVRVVEQLGVRQCGFCDRLRDAPVARAHFAC